MKALKTAGSPHPATYHTAFNHARSLAPVTEYTDFYFTAKASFSFTSSSMFAFESMHVLNEVTLSDEGRQFYFRDRQKNTTFIPKQNNHQVEMEHFSRVIRRMESPRSTGEDGKKSLQALLAIFESAEQGKTVVLNP